MKSITINEIAVNLNISRNTVSKVLNNRGYVSPGLKKKIVKEAVEKGYKRLSPDILEFYNSLNTPSLKIISVIATCPEFSDFWTKIISSIANEISKTDCKLVYNFLTRTEESNFELPDIIRNHQASGIIVINVYNADTINRISNTGLPIVYYDIPVLQSANTALCGDIILLEGENSIFEITSRLIHKKITSLSFIGDITYSRTIYERFQGFLNALRDNHIDYNEQVNLLSSQLLHLYYGEEIDAFLDQLAEYPKAFICANDFIAYMVIQRLKIKGIRVPQDIIVTGYDNITLMDGDTLPTATVHVDTQLLGKRLVEQLLWRMEHENMPYETIHIRPRIIYRF